MPEKDQGEDLVVSQDSNFSNTRNIYSGWLLLPEPELLRPTKWLSTVPKPHQAANGSAPSFLLQRSSALGKAGPGALAHVRLTPRSPSCTRPSRVGQEHRHRFGRGWQEKKLDKTNFFEKLKSIGVTKIIDNWSRDGLIKIYNENSEFSVDLMIFHRSEEWMKRPGWASQLFYLHCDNFHKFPTKLVEQPKPRARFGFFSISVPRSGSEMLKYDYPADWLKIVEHLEC